MEQQKDNLSSLYNGLMSKGYSREDLGDEKTFRSKMSDNNSRKQLYDYVSGRGDFKIGDYDMYEMRLSGTPEYLKRPEEGGVNESSAQENSSLVFEPIQEELPQSTLSPYVRGKGENTEIFGVPYETYTHMKPESQSYYYEQARKKREAENKNAAREYIDTSLEGLKKSIDEGLEKQPGRYTGSRINTYPGMSQASFDKEQERYHQYANLSAAKDLIEDSEQILTESAKKGNTNFASGLGRGLKNAVFDVDTWTAGLTDFAKNSSLLSAVKKAEKGDVLSDEEQKLLDAAAINMAVQAYFSSDLGSGYQAGQVTGQSIPFMLEFAINPVSGSGNAIATGILKNGLKRFGTGVGKQGLKNALVTGGKKMAARLAGDAAAATAMTGTTGLGRVAAGTVERMTGDIQFDFNEDGKIEYAGRENQMGAGEAFGKSAASTTIENFSEMAFNAFGGGAEIVGDAIGKITPKGVNEFFAYASKMEPVQLYKELKNNSMLREVAQRTQFHGIFEEHLEEVVGNLMHIPLGEMTLEQTVDLDNNIDILTGLAPTSIAFGALGLGGMSVQSYRTRKNIERLGNSMTLEQKAALDDVVLKSKGDEKVKNSIRNIVLNRELSESQKKNGIAYLYNRLQEKSAESVRNTETDEAIEKETEEIVNNSDPSTETLTECNRIVLNSIGEPKLVPGHIVGHIGDAPVWQAVGSNERITLKEGEYDPASIQSMSTKDMIDATAEMMREEAQKKAEREAKYSPEIIPPTGGVTFSDSEGRSYTIVQPNPDGGWITEVTSMDEKGNPSVRTVDISDEEYYDVIQAQLDAREESANIQPEVNEVSENPLGNEGVALVDESTMTSNEVDSKPSVTVPTVIYKKDKVGNNTDEVDFENMSVENSINYLNDLTKNPESTYKAVTKTLSKASDILASAQKKVAKIEADGVDYTDKKEIGAYAKAKEELVNAQRKVDYWNSVNEEIAASRVQPGDKTAEAILSMGEPMNGEELAAMMLGTGRLPILYDSYKKETGGRNVEARGMVGLFASKANGGMSIEEAGEQLMLADQEHGTHFFDSNDPNAGRNAIIDILSSARTRGDLFSFIQRNREVMAERERQAELEAYELTISKLAEAARMTPEEFIAFEENIAQMLEERLKDVSDEELKGIFAELYLEENERSRESNEVGTGVPEGEERVGSNEGSSGILSEEWADDARASERSAEQPNGNVETGEPGNSVLPEAATVAGRKELAPVFEKEAPTSIDKTTDTGENQSDLQSDTALLQDVSTSSKNKDIEIQGEKQISVGNIFDRQGNPVNENGNLIVEKIDRIEQLTDEDFNTPSRSVQLPLIPSNVSEAIGSGSKPVIIKKNIFEKNRNTHNELTPDKSRNILAGALYSPNIIGQVQPVKRPNYWVAIETVDKNSVVVLEVDNKKDNVEIVGWRLVDAKGLEKMKRQAEREGGQFLIQTSTNDAAAALSTLPSDLFSENKDSKFPDNKQEKRDFVAPEQTEGESILDYASRIDESKRVHDAGKEVDTNPTEAQKEAGNYKKGHVKIDGFDITIENPKGTVRSGVDADGKPWSITMNNTYGYIRDTEGVDGDHIDVFLGDGGSNVYVVDQVNQDGSFDEHKVMYGFNLEEEARDAYLANYSLGWNGLGAISEVSKEVFKEWIDSSHRKTKPFAEYKVAKVDEFDDGKRFREVDVSEENGIGDVNERFNEELNRYENGEMGDNEMFHLGTPQGAMLSFLPELPIVMRQKTMRKGIEKKHNVDVGALRDMPSMISSPILVFKRSENTIGILTEMKDRDQKNVCVAIEMNKSIQDGKDILEINDVRSFHGRDTKYVVLPIINNGTLRWVDKDKALNWFSSASQPVQQEITNQELYSATKIVESFENPTIEQGKIVSEVEALSDSLHAPVRIVKSVDELTESDSARKRIEKGNRVKGWFDTKSQEVVVYLPHAVSVEDANETVLHEVVGHYGLRKMFGEDFDTFLDNVYANASTEVRKGIVDRANRKGNILDLREATEEYLAELAERGFENAEERSLWQKIKDAFVELLRKAGVELSFELTDNELRYILWKSYQNLESPSIMDRAADVDMQNRLGVGEYALKKVDKTLNTNEEFLSLRESKIENDNEISESISQGEYGKMSEKNSRIEEVASELRRRSSEDARNASPNSEGLSERQQKEVENKAMEEYAKEKGIWIPMQDIFSLGVPAPSGNENDVYLDTKDNSVYKVNNLMNSKKISALLERLKLHNQYFPQTKYELVGFSGFGSGDVFPVLKQDYIVNTTYATLEEIDSYMQSLGFNQSGEAAYYNGDVVISDLRPRNVLKDIDGDIYVVDADFREITPDGDKRFRTGESTDEERESDGTIEAYETALKKQGFRAQEAFQDSTLALKVFQDVVLAKDGSKLKSFEDSYKAENRMSSVSTREIEVFSKVFLNPIITEVARLIKEEDATYRDITGYLIAKHGLERNIVLRERKASEVADKAVKESIGSATREQRKGHISEDEYNSVINEANLKRNEVYQKELEKNANKDYSGLTGLMENFADENDSDFTAFAEQFVSDFESKHNTKDLWKFINKATNQTLKKSYESGLMSLEQYDSLKGRFKNYVPLRGWDETMADEVYEYLDNMRSPVNSLLKSADGRKSLADDPIATIGNMADSTILQGNRNIMKQNFLNFVINHPSDLAQVKDVWYVKDNVSGDFVPSFPNIPENATAEDVANIVSEHEENMKFLEKDGLAMRGKNGLELSYKILPYQKSEHIVSMKRNGKDVVVYINGNPRVAQALNGLTNPDVESNAMLSGLGKLNRILASNFTTRNPAFVLSNLSRDLIFSTSAVAVKEPPLYLARFSTNIPKSIAAVIKGIRGNGGTSEADKYFQEFLDNGGETGYANLTNVDKYKKMIQKEIKHLTKKDYFKLVRQGLELFEDFNRMAEDVARFNTYMTSRQEGRSIVEAINDAKEITVNFNKKGAGAKSVNKLEPLYTFGNLAAYSAGIFKNLYLFFNAGIQSLFNFNSLYKKNWKKFGGLLGGFTAAGFLTPLVNSLLQSFGGDGDDEDYYANLSEWTRRNNLCLYIPGSKGHFITIPLPIELRAFYGLGDMAYMQTIGNGGKKGTEIAYDAVNQLTELLPLNPLGNNGDLGATLMPDAAKPIWQVMKNEDFTGRPIYKKNSFNEDMPEWTKTYKGASKWLTELSEWSNELGGGDKYKTAPDFLNWNPAVVEHVLQGYFGGMATTLNQLGKTMAAGVESVADGQKSEDLTWRNAPVLSRFINDASDERSAFRGINEKYYQLYDVYKEVDKNLHGYSKEVSSGNLDYLDKLNGLYQSEDYKTYEIFKRSKNQIDRLRKLESELSDAMGDAKDKLQAEIKKLKKEIVEKVK